MNISRIWLIAILYASVAGADVAQEGQDINVIRGGDGELTDESLVLLEELKAYAVEHGYVTLWLTANVPYTPVTSDVTDKQAEKQDKEIRKLFESILKPLVKDGSVWFVPERPEAEGPGHLVRANSDGLMMLAQDTRILNIHVEQ